MSLTDFNSKLRERLRAFVWRQWAQLGLAAANVEERDGWIIDPEALLLLTGTVGRWDPRLFDEAIDWLAVNASFINIPRLKSLSRDFSFQSLPVVGAMCAVAQKTDSRLRWRFRTPNPRGKTEPLFWRGTEPAPVDFGDHDETFHEFGFDRGRLELRCLSKRFNPAMPECALLRLRSLIGVTARAEILLYLYSHGASHPSQMAREIGFSQKNVQDTLVDMSASHIVLTGKLVGRKKSYFIAKRDKGKLLHTPTHLPEWVTWPPLFHAIEIVWWKFLELERASLSPSLLSMELRDLKDSVEALSERSGIRGMFREDRGISGDAFVKAALVDIDAWLHATLREP